MENIVIGVRFKKAGKLCYFDPSRYTFNVGDFVIVNTQKGQELGRVVKLVDRNLVENNDNKIEKILRPASKRDLQVVRENEIKAQEALEYCKEEVKKLNLNMKVLIAEYTFDLSKLTIYFSSEDRVDFRELVKSLASKYKVRIELRQVGSRDEVKAYPNIGMCGKEVCCRAFLQDFEPVTIKMAKEQGLQINMSKLSGACGKLMCCLKYEEDEYKENLKKLPKVGDIVKVPKEKLTGKVTNIDILGLKVKVKFGTTKEDEYYEIYPVNEISWEKQEEKSDND